MAIFKHIKYVNAINTLAKVKINMMAKIKDAQPDIMNIYQILKK